jgi:hypothetical protein
MQITRKNSVSAFIDSFDHFTRRFSFIFIPSAFDRMSLNKQKENGLEATSCCTASYCPAGSSGPRQQLTSQAVQVPMFVQFALPSAAMVAAASAAAERPTEPERSSGQ